MKFSGKDRDAEMGLDCFGGRYFASGGRFVSPDRPFAALGGYVCVEAGRDPGLSAHEELN